MIGQARHNACISGHERPDQQRSPIARLRDPGFRDPRSRDQGDPVFVYGQHDVPPLLDTLETMYAALGNGDGHVAFLSDPRRAGVGTEYAIGRYHGAVDDGLGGPELFDQKLQVLSLVVVAIGDDGLRSPFDLHQQGALFVAAEHTGRHERQAQGPTRRRCPVRRANNAQSDVGPARYADRVRAWLSWA